MKYTLIRESTKMNKDQIKTVVKASTNSKDRLEKVVKILDFFEEFNSVKPSSQDGKLLAMLRNNIK